MELLGYVLGIFGLFIFTKGIKPTLEFINKTTEKRVSQIFWTNGYICNSNFLCVDAI